VIQHFRFDQTFTKGVCGAQDVVVLVPDSDTSSKKFQHNGFKKNKTIRPQDRILQQDSHSYLRSVATRHQLIVSIRRQKAEKPEKSKSDRGLQLCKYIEF